MSVLYMTLLEIYRAEIYRAEIFCHTFHKSVLKLIIGALHIFLNVSTHLSIRGSVCPERVFVHDGINDSVEDYNSSRVGVVCRLSPNLNMRFFPNASSRGLKFCMVPSYDLKSEIFIKKKNRTTRPRETGSKG